MKFTLQVGGREMTFSEPELRFIIEEYFRGSTTKRTMTDKVAQKPAEDAWFEVKPKAIDKKLFGKKRKDKRQEVVRRIIVEAFAEMKDNPEKYGKNFKIMMLKRKEMVSKVGDHNADWVERAFVSAQRIENGESWEAICNDKNTVDWYRVVVLDAVYKPLNMRTFSTMTAVFSDTEPMVVRYE